MHMPTTQVTLPSVAKPSDGFSNTGGSPDELVPCERTSMHPRSYAAERYVETASKDTRTMMMEPKMTDLYKG